MSDQAVPAGVVARIRKLLALANNNSNEHEASAAVAKAQAIMAEFNITTSETGETSETTREKAETDLSVSKPWHEDLMAAIAKNNFCAHWVESGISRRFDGTGSLKMRRRHMLIGRQANVLVATSVYTYLVQTMVRLCPYEDARGRSNASWFAGCGDRLIARLADQRRESEAASRARRQEPGRGDGTSLVLSDVYSSEEDLNNDMRYGYPPGTTGARRAASDARMEAWRAQWKEEAKIRPQDIVREPAPEVKPETDKEREKREARERRWGEAYYRRQQKEAGKVDQHAYARGSAAGRDIGLDTQISSTGPKKSLS